MVNHNPSSPGPRRVCLSTMDVVELRVRGGVFQKTNLFPRSIFDNVAYGLRINGMTAQEAELAEKVEASLRAAVLWGEVRDRLKESAFG